MKLLSVVVPCYNEEETVADFYTEFIKNRSFLAEKELDYEIIYVDDGSRDGTVAEIKKLHEADERVHMVSFSRNFGKEAAMYAGFEHAKGDYVVTMDVDLQDPPSMLPEMFSHIEEGYDSVATRRVSRKGEPPIRSFFARLFYRLMKKISKTEIVDGARDYRLMTRQMVDAILSVKEYNRFTKGIYGWVGFRTKWLEFENVERKKGDEVVFLETVCLFSGGNYGFFHGAPCLCLCSGHFILCAGLLMIVVIIIKTLVFGDPTSGWPSMICILCLISGVQLFCMGIIGQYLSKAYMEVKGRPIYISREEL